MKTGRITWRCWDGEGTMHEKVFQFSFNRYFNYLHALRIIRHLVKPNYSIDFRGGVKKPKKWPVLSWGQFCTAVRDYRFYGVAPEKWIPLPVLCTECWHGNYEGKEYTFFRSDPLVESDLYRLLAEHGFDVYHGKNNTLFVKEYIPTTFQGRYYILLPNPSKEIVEL